MNWCISACLAAFSKAASQYFSKKVLRSLSPLDLTLVSAIFLVVGMVPIVLFSKIDPIRVASHWPAVCGSIVGISCAIFFMNAAIRIGSLTKTLPFLAFVPICTAIAGGIVNSEVPSMFGWAGILLVSVGGIFFESSTQSLSLRLIFRPDVRLMLLAAVGIGVGACCDRILLQEYSLLTCIWYTSIGRAICFIALWLYFTRKTLSSTVHTMKASWKILTVISIFFAADVAFGCIALSGAYAVYGVSIMRLSIVITTLLGILKFNESLSKSQFICTAVMLSGAILIGW